MVYYVFGAKHTKLHKQQTFDIIRRIITLFLHKRKYYKKNNYHKNNLI